jgi:hypothetical protein
VIAYDEADNRYLIDGVAIHGVSGGPAFAKQKEDSHQLVGVVCAYMPNRASERGVGVATPTATVGKSSRRISRSRQRS